MKKIMNNTSGIIRIPAMEDSTIDCVLLASELSSDLAKAIETNLRKKEDTIIKGKGYLKEVRKILSVSDGNVLTDGSVRFRVKFQGLLILPEKNKPFTGDIFMISEHGVYLVVNKIRAFIPKANMPSQTVFFITPGVTSFTIGDKKYTKGDEFTCTVVELTYKATSIDVVGTLISKKVVVRGVKP